MSASAAEVAETVRAKWMRFVAQRENRALQKFAQSRHINVIEPPASDDWSTSCTNREMYNMIAVVDRLVVLSTPNTTEKNALRRQKLEKQRQAELSEFTDELRAIPKKVDPGKGFFWANYPQSKDHALVPSTKLRVHPKRLPTAEELEERNDKKAHRAAWQHYKKCTFNSIING